MLLTIRYYENIVRKEAEGKIDAQKNQYIHDPSEIYGRGQFSQFNRPVSQQSDGGNPFMQETQ